MKKALKLTCYITGTVLVFDNVKEWYDNRETLMNNSRAIISKSKKALIATGLFYVFYKI